MIERTTTLGELLPHDALVELRALLRTHGPPTIEQLKALCRKHEAALLDKGVVADYLAYVILAMVQQVRSA